MSEDKLQLSLRGDGKLRPIISYGNNLAEAVRKSIIDCYDLGARIETPKYKIGGSLGCDADITLCVENTEDPRLVYTPAMWDGPEGVMQYILEVTHGIHNDWLKSPEHPTRWGYTYNGRFVDQLPFVFQRIKHEWNEKKDQWGDGVGRISGRDYQFTTWRAADDIILEQEDPPCLQRCNIRFLLNRKGNIVMNFLTDWRSRDQFKALNENDVAFLKLMTLLSHKVSDMLGIPIKLGSYIDHSTSLHLYGDYFDRENLDNIVQVMKENSYEKYAKTLDEYFEGKSGRDSVWLKRYIAAQKEADKRGLGKQLPEETLKENGIDIDSFPYPPEWDSWPKSWDAEPDLDKLARVWGKKDILKKAASLLGMNYDEFKGMFHPQSSVRVLEKISPEKTITDEFWG